MTDDRFACKLIPLLRLLTHSAIADVRREIQIMHHLTGNRNIVELRAAYEDQSAVHLVMEVCEGGELFERKFYSEKRAAGICREIVTVVRDCHCLGVMHRDLKPENFLFLSKEKENSVEGDRLWAVHFP
ncbi:calcium-dependent protein kinase 1-like [Asparagus officinalis]|uniref:calcium-dependent protein kinase 1-like n=1 Tax=Asparagus officinalis TaxID=4686 RepID=UPI00098E42FB|nr:calcium-dependent protein kinase 1-like [Asparagus officinalis]